MSLTSFSLAVIFIIRLFSTFAFPVPKLTISSRILTFLTSRNHKLGMPISQSVHEVKSTLTQIFAARKRENNSFITSKIDLTVPVELNLVSDIH